MHDTILDNDLNNRITEELVSASKLKRFINLVVDTIVYFVFYRIILVILSLFYDFYSLNPEIDETDRSFLFVIGYILYYTLFEYFISKTLGKFLTRTKVVSVDGLKPRFANLFGRSVIRTIPIDVLSFLGKVGFHDTFSFTKVVEDSK